MTLVFREREEGFVCLERDILKPVHANRRDSTEKKMMWGKEGAPGHKVLTEGRKATESPVLS